MGSLCSCCSNEEGEKDPYIYWEKDDPEKEGSKVSAVNDFTCPKYDEEYKKSMETRDEFWLEQAKELSWTEEPTKALEEGTGNNCDKWFSDGKMNICFNCIDRHVDAGRDCEPCFCFSSAHGRLKATIDFDQVCQNVSKLAHVLKNKFEIKPGD